MAGRTSKPVEFDLQAESSKRVSGYASIDDVEVAAPTTVVSGPRDAGQAGRGSGPPRSRKTTTKQQEPDWKDERVNRFLSSALSGGLSDVIEAGFEFWAWTAQNPELKLDGKEREWWADYFYTCAKRLRLSPDSPYFLAALGVVQLGKNVAVRYAKILLAGGQEVPEFVKDVLGNKQTIEGTPVQEHGWDPRKKPV